METVKTDAAKDLVYLEKLKILHKTSDIEYLNESDLRERLQHLEEIVYNLDAAIFIHNLKTNHHVWTNNNYQNIIGYTAEEMEKMGIEEARKTYHPDDLEIIKKKDSIF